MTLDIKRIKELIHLAEATGINGLAIEEGDTKVEIKRQPDGVVTALPTPAALVAPSSTAAGATEEHHGLTAIKAPMTGTFYAAASPDQPPYVQPGVQISAGQPVCIIEAMKTFNEIESEVSGTIEKILVKNQQPVDFGQVLMLVRE